MDKAQEQADIQRAEAKRLLNAMFGFNGDIASTTVNKAVDCIIGAALLEMVAIQQEAMKPKGEIK